MERIYWRHFSSQAKAIGTIVSMAGAFVVILYKGPPILKIHSSISYNTLQFSPNLNWILGGFLCAGDSLLSSMWYIYQVGHFLTFYIFHLPPFEIKNKNHFNHYVCVLVFGPFSFE